LDFLEANRVPGHALPSFWLSRVSRSSLFGLDEVHNTVPRLANTLTSRFRDVDCCTISCHTFDGLRSE
jgi:hypothetical protein